MGNGHLERLRPRRYAAHGSAQLWQVPGSSHVGGIHAQSDEYERRVIDFVDRALLDDPR